ncbi:MAG TPA: FMN-binding negative transcriptional regulator [Gammaproteobacteria bacterium]
MYVPKQFEESRLEVLHALIKAHPLAVFVIFDGTELVVNHIPFFIDERAGPSGTLRGHVARANPVWRKLSSTVQAAAIFQGPQSYITPSWYPSKHAHGKAVPTWNYAVVHAFGYARSVEDRDWLLAHVTELTDQQEARRALPWRVSDAPSDYIDAQLGKIVGIELPIETLTGKWKVSQNRAVSDRLGVAAGLRSRDDEDARAMADLVMQHVPQPPD